MLSDKQRFVIRHRYGFDDAEIQTLKNWLNSSALRASGFARSSLKRLGNCAAS